MTDESTRAGARWMIPWVALVLVSVFAFMQLDAAQRARAELTKARDNERAAATGRVVGQKGLPRTVMEAVSKRERILDDALSDEQAKHREAQARARQLEEQLAAERARADRVEALRATEQARAEALEQHRADVAANLARTKALLEKGQSLVQAEPVRQWLEDVASGDKTRVAYARARASKATPEQIEALRAVLNQAEPAHLPAAARLANALPTGEATTTLVGDLVLRLPQSGVRLGLDRIGAERLMSFEIVARVLAEGSTRLRDELVTRVTPHRATWTEEQRRALASALMRLLDSDEIAVLRSGLKGIAHLRLAGGVARLIELTRHESAVIRAGAAYALSRVPDLDTVKDRVRALVPVLLDDEGFLVRTAGSVLAEVLIGGRVTFDPKAPAGERADAIQRIKKRLGL